MGLPAEWISVPFFTAEWISIRFWQYNIISIHGWLIHSARHAWPASRLVGTSLLGIYGGKGGPMDAWLKQVQMVRTFVTPLWRNPGRVPDPKASCPLGMDALLEQLQMVRTFVTNFCCELNSLAGAPKMRKSVAGFPKGGRA